MNKIKQYMSHIIEAAPVILSSIPVIFLQMFQFFYNQSYYIRECEFYIPGFYFLKIIQVFVVASFFIILIAFDDICYKFSQIIALNLLPVEVIMLVVFAQYYFRIAVILSVLCALSSLLFYILIKYVENHQNKSVKRNKNSKKRTYMKLMFRFSLKAYAIILLPAVLLGLYYLINNTPLLRPSVNAANIIVSNMNNSDELWSNENIAQIAKLNKDDWQNLRCDEKIDILQKLANIEITYLNINPVRVVSSKLDIRIGEYDYKKKIICIDYEHLKYATPEKIINTIEHEIRHAYQDFWIEMFDWNNEETLTSVFCKEVRERKAERETYIDTKKDYDKYYLQSQEHDAREYAQERCTFIISHIKDYKKSREYYQLTRFAFLLKYPHDPKNIK